MKKLLFILFFLPLFAFCQLNNYKDYIPSSTDGLVIHKSYYTYSFLKDKKLPEWTIYFSSNNMRLGTVKRFSRFQFDKSIEAEFQITSRDFKKTGYDRGTLVPSADMSFDSVAMRESMLYTNITPFTPMANRGAFRKVESLVRNFRLKYDSLVIITGCVFKDSDDWDVTLDGVIPIPEFYYKIVFDPERYSAIGFVVPNFIESQKPVESYIYSVIEIEKLTGIKFFSNLPKKIQVLIENEISYEDWVIEDENLGLFNSHINSSEYIQDSKMAFIIGNSNYYRNKDKLVNSVNDAELMFKTFTDIGFDTVIIYKDLNNIQMKTSLDEFLDISENYDVGIFYYAGHGVQDVNGNIFLVPTDYDGRISIDSFSYPLNKLIKQTTSNHESKSMFIIDACRTTRRGIDEKPPLGMEPINLKLALSTSFGQVALDHPERDNSFYTSTLSESLRISNNPVNIILNQTWNKVFNFSHHKQSPVVYYGQGLYHLILFPK